MRRVTLAVALAGGLSASGCDTNESDDSALRVANLQGRGGGVVAGALSLSDESGAPIVIQKKGGNGPAEGSTPGGQSARVTVDTRPAGGAFRPATGVALGDDHPTVDVVVVADNSGSEAESLEDMREAIAHFAHVILASSHPDRVGLVRVSTEATLMWPLVEDEAALGPALDALFVSKGWTALWDGVRLANEHLVERATVRDGAAACLVPSAPAIVLFTDGRDNNSADEHDTRYAGDGVDTTLADLMALSVNGVPTSIYAVGVGGDVDEDGLTALAEATDGRYTAIGHFGQLIGALQSAGSKLAAQQPVCFTPAACGDTEARVRVTIGNGNNAQVVERTIALAPTCGG